MLGALLVLDYHSEVCHGVEGWLVGYGWDWWSIDVDHNIVVGGEKLLRIP